MASEQALNWVGWAAVLGGLLIVGAVVVAAVFGVVWLVRRKN